jgi:hypothetical protein
MATEIVSGIGIVPLVGRAAFVSDICISGGRNEVPTLVNIATSRACDIRYPQRCPNCAI